MELRVLAPGIVTIDGFFDVATCRRFVDVAEAAGFEDAPITTGRGDGGATVLDVGERIAVEPIRGRALLFLHQLRHTGAEVIAGQKDVVRTDAMFPA